MTFDTQNKDDLDAVLAALTKVPIDTNDLVAIHHRVIGMIMVELHEINRKLELLRNCIKILNNSSVREEQNAELKRIFELN